MCYNLVSAMVPTGAERQELKMEHGPTKTNTVNAGGIVFRAGGYRGGASVNAETEYYTRVAEATQGLTDLIRIAKAVLRRLDIEAAERGNDEPFLCNAYRPDLRVALARIEGNRPSLIRVPD